MQYTDMDVFPVIVSLRQAQRAAMATNTIQTTKDARQIKKAHNGLQTVTDIVALFAALGAVMTIWIFIAALA